MKKLIFPSKLSFARTLLPFTQLFVAMIAFLILNSCSSKKQEKAPAEQPVAVTIQEVGIADVPFYIEGIGALSAYWSVDIKAQVTGMLLSMHFVEGSFVKKGDLLYIIDQRPFKAALESALGTLELDEANLRYAKKRLESYKELLKHKFFSEINYADYERDFETWVATLRRDKGEAETAKINLGYTEIKAPIDGYLGDTNFNPGNIIPAVGSTPMVTLRKVTPIYAYFSVPELYLSDIRKYQAQAPLQIDFYFQNAVDPSLKGELNFIDNTVDPNTGMIRLIGIIPNEDVKGWPGQYIRAKLFLKLLKDSVVVHETAIQLGAKGPFVYVVKEDMSVEERYIETGIRQGEMQVVQKGLSSGEKVVTNGQLNLYNGAKIHIPAKSEPDR